MRLPAQQSAKTKQQIIEDSVTLRVSKNSDTPINNVTSRATITSNKHTRSVVIGFYLPKLPDFFVEINGHSLLNKYTYLLDFAL